MVDVTESDRQHLSRTRLLEAIERLRAIDGSYHEPVPPYAGVVVEIVTLVDRIGQHARALVRAEAHSLSHESLTALRLYRRELRSLAALLYAVSNEARIVRGWSKHQDLLGAPNLADDYDEQPSDYFDHLTVDRVNSFHEFPRAPFPTSELVRQLEEVTQQANRPGSQKDDVTDYRGGQRRPSSPSAIRSVTYLGVTYSVHAVLEAAFALGEALSRLSGS